MKKILVVDDDTDLLATMKAYLKRQGYEVAVTTSCNEGLEIFNSFRPDLVFLDINVGDEDGREMCVVIKPRTEFQQIAVILISADHEELKLYRDFGADSYLKKPFQFSGLNNAIDACFKRVI